METDDDKKNLSTVLGEQSPSSTPPEAEKSQAGTTEKVADLMGDTDKRYPCPCCGFLTLFEPIRGTYDICPVCGWEDDEVQFDDPDYRGGANHLSLNEARINYAKFGASDRDSLKRSRPPRSNEIP